MDGQRGYGEHPPARAMDDHASLRAWLNSTKKRGMALGLANTHRAVLALEVMPDQCEVVHVAGSNGKGTFAATLSAAMTLEGVRHVLFTSPHLMHVEERIRVNGVPVETDTFDQALGQIKEMSERLAIPLTFFEVTFLAALVIAHTLEVEAMVVETGLGGRLDATRVVKADLCVVTALSLEHTDVLGTTLPAIAREKAAIARPNQPILVRRPEASEVREAVASEVAAAGQSALGESKQPAHLEWVDVEATATAADEAMTLARAAWPRLTTIADRAFPVFQGVQWPARMQKIASPNRPETTYLLDGAHNPSGMLKSCRELMTRAEVNGGPWALLLGSTPQVDMEAMLEPLAELCSIRPPDMVVLTVPQGGRYPGVEGQVMKAHLENAGIAVDHVIDLPFDAVQALETSPRPLEAVVSIGSLYLQGNVMEALGADDQASLSIRAKV